MDGVAQTVEIIRPSDDVAVPLCNYFFCSANPRVTSSGEFGFWFGTYKQVLQSLRMCGFKVLVHKGEFCCERNKSESMVFPCATQTFYLLPLPPSVPSQFAHPWRGAYAVGLDCGGV